MSDQPAPITASQADDIILELRTIRKLLESEAEARKAAPPPPARPAYSAPAQGSASSSGGGKFDDEPIPQPSEIIVNARQVCVHFGKNTGKPLQELGERSIAWYAAEQPAKVGNNGRPFAPRPQDTLLKNAARTYWHELRGTLDTAGRVVTQALNQPAASPAQSKPAAASSADDENVPF